jgi:hypothetical protein
MRRPRFFLHTILGIVIGAGACAGPGRSLPKPIVNTDERLNLVEILCSVDLSTATTVAAPLERLSPHPAA